MKLYTYDAAPNPKRLQYFLDYKGIEIETVQVDMMAQEQLGDQYKAINPLGTVPALVLDDGTVLTEVVGICVYLEALHPDQPLMGSSALEQAQVISWDHSLLNTLMTGVAEILRNTSKGFIGRALPGPLAVEQIPALAERGRLRVDHAWQSLDAHLADTPWVAGSFFSLADIDLLCGAEFSGWVKASIPEDATHLLEWQQRAVRILGNAKA